MGETGRPIVKYSDSLPRAVQKTDRDAVWDLDLGGPKKVCIRWVHIGATWQIPLNCPCAVVMRPVVNLL